MGSSEPTSPFDALAGGYDAGFTHSACARWLRARVWERAAKLFEGRHHILELGCGTGEDAVHFARAGHRVTAIDASAEMIRVARGKAVAASVADRIEFHALPVESLGDLPPSAPFDAVFSNFGVVNCVADVRGMARTLVRYVPPGAPLLFVVMGRYVPWEWGWYLARGDRARAFRRLRRAGVQWRGLRIHYPTPRELARDLSPVFAPRRRAALGFALPPSYAAGWLDRAPRALAALAALERATSPLTAALADHFVFEAVRAPRIAGLP